MSDEKDYRKLVDKAAEQVRNGTAVEDPSEFMKTKTEVNVVLDDGSSGGMLSLSPTVVSAPEYVLIYDRESGLPSTVMAHMATKKLTLRRQNGKPVWTMDKPEYIRHGKNLLCYLNPNREDYHKYAPLGFQPCRKSNIPSEFQIREHMAKKHKNEWKMILGYEDRQDKQEDRSLQREILQKLVGANTELTKPELTKPEPTKPEPTTLPKEVRQKGMSAENREKQSVRMKRYHAIRKARNGG